MKPSIEKIVLSVAVSRYATGFKGRTGLFEVWNMDRADYEKILTGADEDCLRTRQQRTEFVLACHAVSLIELGLVSVSETMHLGLSLPWENE